MITLLLAATLTLASPERAFQQGTNCIGPVQPAVYANATISVGYSYPYLLSSVGTAESSDCWANKSGTVSGLHYINSASGPVAAQSFSAEVRWIGTLSVGGAIGQCYSAAISASSSDGASQAAGSSADCTEPAPPPPDLIEPPLLTQCNNWDYVSACSPIVINFENGDYRLTGRDAPVIFDMGGTGVGVSMGWTAAGANEAFLWLDRDHNSRVDSGAELFGNFTPLASGHNAANGFDALRESDENEDGVIDEHDALWWQLMLWRDLNHNGISEATEVSSLVGSSVVAIGLRHHWTGRFDAFGNAYRYKAAIHMLNEQGHARTKPLYDIYFVRVR